MLCTSFLFNPEQNQNFNDSRASNRCRLRMQIYLNNNHSLPVFHTRVDFRIFLSVTPTGGSYLRRDDPNSSQRSRCTPLVYDGHHSPDVARVRRSVSPVKLRMVQFPQRSDSPPLFAACSKRAFFACRKQKSTICLGNNFSAIA